MRRMFWNDSEIPSFTTNLISEMEFVLIHSSSLFTFNCCWREKGSIVVLYICRRGKLIKDLNTGTQIDLKEQKLPSFPKKKTKTFINNYIKRMAVWGIKISPIWSGQRRGRTGLISLGKALLTTATNCPISFLKPIKTKQFLCSV